MAAIKVPTSFNIDLEFEIPEFYRRLVALLIDMVIEFSYLILAMYIFNRIQRNVQDYSDDTAFDLSAIQILFLLPIFIYHIVLELTMNGQSAGKKIMAVKVVNENGGKASFSQFFIRWILRISDVWIVALVLTVIFSDFRSMELNLALLAALAFLVTDIILVISSRKSQRIGDILARTILIRTNRKASIEETVFQEVADNYTPLYPEIMRLSDRDINAIKSILETARKKGDIDMAISAADKIKQHLGIKSSLSPFEFLDTLLKDYNYISVK